MPTIHLDATNSTDAALYNAPRYSAWSILQERCNSISSLLMGNCCGQFGVAGAAHVPGICSLVLYFRLWLLCLPPYLFLLFPFVFVSYLFLEKTNLHCVTGECLWLNLNVYGHLKQTQHLDIVVLCRKPNCHSPSQTDNQPVGRIRLHFTSLQLSCHIRVPNDPLSIHYLSF